MVYLRGWVFSALSDPELGWTPLLNDYFSDELSQAAGPLAQVVWVLFAIVPERCSSSSVPGAFTSIICTETTNTKLPLTSKEPGLHPGTPQGTGARPVPDLHPVPRGSGHGDPRPVASPHTSSPSHQQLLPEKPTAQLQCPGKHKHCLLNNICLSNVKADPALCSAHKSILF